MILVLIGRSGCGKSTIAARLKNYGYVPVKTCTTRDRRDGESEDAYYFMTHEEFQKHLQNDDFVEFDVYGENMYGTLKSALKSDEKLVCIVTPEGAATIKKEFPEAFIVNIETSMKESVMRAIVREKELNPATLNRICKRGMTDYYLYENLICDIIIKNPEGASIDDIAKRIEEAHNTYMINSVLKSTTGLLKDCRTELEKYGIY